MVKIVGSAAVTVDQYFQIWIGLVGRPVGFHLSSDFASRIIAPSVDID